MKREWLRRAGAGEDGGWLLQAVRHLSAAVLHTSQRNLLKTLLLALGLRIILSTANPFFQVSKLPMMSYLVLYDATAATWQFNVYFPAFKSYFLLPHILLLQPLDYFLLQSWHPRMPTREPDGTLNTRQTKKDPDNLLTYLVFVGPPSPPPPHTLYTHWHCVQPSSINSRKGTHNTENPFLSLHDPEIFCFFFFLISTFFGCPQVYH